MSNNELLDDLDMDIGMDEVELSPEFVDMSTGSYYLRVAGFTKKAITISQGDDGDDEADEVDGTRRAVVFQITGIQAAENPAPELGGCFSIGGIMNYRIARDQFIRIIKKAVHLAEANEELEEGETLFSEGKHSLREYGDRLMELYDRDTFLLCSITLRDQKYPQVRSMQCVPASAVEGWNPEEFVFADFDPMD